MFQVVASEGAFHAHRNHEFIIVIDEHSEIPATDQKEVTVVIRHKIMAAALLFRSGFNA